MVVLNIRFEGAWKQTGAPYARAANRAKLDSTVAEEPRKSSSHLLTTLVGGPAERVAATCVLGAAAISIGALRPLEGLWGVRLWGVETWGYFPFSFSAAAAAIGLALCLRPVRNRLLFALNRFKASWSAWHLAFVGLFLAALFFFLRERIIIVGDGKILLYATTQKAFYFPDVGATWLFHNLSLLASILGLERLAVTQAGLSAAGAATVLCLVGLARIVAPTRALAFVAIAISGGLLRVLVGHIEVYAFVLLAASAYLWSGAAFLSGRAPFWCPPLVFGIGLWIHPSFAFLAPSLALLVADHARTRGSRVTPWIAAAAIAAAPATLFTVGALSFGSRDELDLAWAALNSVALGTGEHGSYWVRFPFSPAGPGTQWALLSAAQLRFLANCLYLLAPAALPLILGVSLTRRSHEHVPATTYFLGIAALGTMLYALALRPVHGPYDWDLFSLTALCLSCFAALLWSRCQAEWAGGIALLAVAASFLFVALPLILLGLHSTHDAGPLNDQKLESQAGETPLQTLNRTIDPWL